MEWTSEFPMESGNYWMYGFTSPFDRARNSPRMRLVRVNVNKNGHAFYVTEGHFIYKEDCDGSCLWAKAELPKAPHTQLEAMLGVFINQASW